MVLNKIFYSRSFVFDLFIDEEMPNYYRSNIINTFTNSEFKTAHTFKPLFKGVSIIKDIPDYLKLDFSSAYTFVKHKDINQYKGFIVNLKGYNNTSDYINNNLSKRNIKNLLSKERKLNQNHKISHCVYYGSIDKMEYDTLFDTFYDLLKKRFDEKKITNRYLSRWKELQGNCYHKILDKKASLHVIYNKDVPITITLNYHLNDIVFSHIQVYDTTYSKYNMGDITMLKHIAWCLTHNKPIFDLSMGETPYKTKWCNESYTMIYHIWYNKKSIIATVIASIVKLELKIIQYLRDKNIVGKLFSIEKIMYRLKALTPKTKTC